MKYKHTYSKQLFAIVILTTAFSASEANNFDIEYRELMNSFLLADACLFRNEILDASFRLKSYELLEQPEANDKAHGLRIESHSSFINKLANLPEPEKSVLCEIEGKVAYDHLFDMYYNG